MTEFDERSTTACDAMSMLWRPVIENHLRLVPPSMIIYRNQTTPYMSRWHLVDRNRSGNVYLHEYHDGDHTEDPHDHPWDSWSYCLKGCYTEEFFSPYLPVEPGLNKTGDRSVVKGDVVSRLASLIHRIAQVEPGTQTLFLTGPYLGRSWGFWKPDGKFQGHNDMSRDETDEHGTVHSYPLEPDDQAQG